MRTLRIGVGALAVCSQVNVHTVSQVAGTCTHDGTAGLCGIDRNGRTRLNVSFAAVLPSAARY